MVSFLIALAVLVGGYFIYGTVVDRIVGTDASRKMPAETLADGVDYIPMPAWRVFLIQFLNIAGMGPIFGAIMGVMFGPMAFVWIALGTIFAGAVHDFVSGVMSVRSDGASLPEIVGAELGMGIRQVMRVFSVVLLILVGTVFVLTPADLLAGLTPGWMDRIFWVGLIFVYYILATLLPIDKIIGRFYPIFGVSLLFMALGLLGVMIFTDVAMPLDFSEGFDNRRTDGLALFPMLFVSIACGAISGFHATQSPMMARCLTNERLARPIFYGAMVAEGVVALIWAAAAIAFTGGYEQLADYMAAHGNRPGDLVADVSYGWLGTFGGVLALLGVIVAPITTGDTALRSARLMVAESLHFSQHDFKRRLMVSLPLFAVVFFIMMIDFDSLWRYFAWSNQTLASITLWAVTVWLARQRKAYVISLIPAMFMTSVCVTYILYSPKEGFGVDLMISTAVGIVCAVALGVAFFACVMRGKIVRQPV